MTTTRRCTCAGTAPGYPQHQSYCGQPEPDEPELLVSVPLRWVDEVAIALDAATIINQRTLRTGRVEALYLGNHDRLIREASQWSVFARNARSVPSLPVDQTP